MSTNKKSNTTKKGRAAKTGKSRDPSTNKSKSKGKTTKTNKTVVKATGKSETDKTVSKTTKDEDNKEAPLWKPRVAKVKLERLVTILGKQAKTREAERQKDIADCFLNLYKEVMGEKKFKELNIVCEEDTGNHYITKGTGVYDKDLDKNVYPCAVAHLDQVHDTSPDYRIYVQGNVIFAFGAKTGRWNEGEYGQLGTGGDDLCGVWLCLELLIKYPNVKVALFTDEEGGCIGSNRSDMSFFEDCTFVLQGDRNHRTYDFIDHTNGSPTMNDEFREACAPIMEKYGYSHNRGTSTDVGALINRGLGCCAANIACGYHKAHSDSEIVKINEVFTCLEFMEELFGKLGNKVWKFEKPKVEVYKGRGSWDGKWDDWDGYKGKGYKGSYFGRNGRNLKNSDHKTWNSTKGDWDYSLNYKKDWVKKNMLSIKPGWFIEADKKEVGWILEVSAGKQLSIKEQEEYCNKTLITYSDFMTKRKVKLLHMGDGVYFKIYPKDHSTFIVCRLLSEIAKKELKKVLREMSEKTLQSIKSAKDKDGKEIKDIFKEKNLYELKIGERARLDLEVADKRLWRGLISPHWAPKIESSSVKIGSKGILIAYDTDFVFEIDKIIHHFDVILKRIGVETLETSKYHKVVEIARYYSELDPLIKAKEVCIEDCFLLDSAASKKKLSENHSRLEEEDEVSLCPMCLCKDLETEMEEISGYLWCNSCEFYCHMHEHEMLLTMYVEGSEEAFGQEVRKMAISKLLI